MKYTKCVLGHSSFYSIEKLVHFIVVLWDVRENRFRSVGLRERSPACVCLYRLGPHSGTLWQIRNIVTSS